jgi:protein gp37
MSETKIPYLTKTWNFHTGCLHFEKGICPIPKDDCWARGNFKRFKWDFTPTLHPEKLLEPLSWKSPQRVGVCFTGDLFGEWVDPNQNTDFAGMQLNQLVSTVMCTRPQHQFFFLTKNPAGYSRWSTEWPNNAWLGATVCNRKMLDDALCSFIDTEAKHYWLSIEPLMEFLNLQSQTLEGVDFVVIGGWSTPAQRKAHPIEISWIREICKACDRAGIPVYLKDNLASLFGISLNPFPTWAFKNGYYTDETHPFVDLHLRQQLPEAK